MISLFGKPEPTLLEKLKDSVSKTRTELAAKVEQILTGDRPVDPALLKQLESALLGADIGVTHHQGSARGAARASEPAQARRRVVAESLNSRIRS